MSKLFIKGYKEIDVRIYGLEVKLTEKMIRFPLESQSGFQGVLDMNQAMIRQVYRLLRNLPDPCPDHLVFDLEPGDTTHTSESKIALDSFDRDIIQKVLNNAPSLLTKEWLNREDANNLIEAFKEIAPRFASNPTFDPDRN